VDQVDIKVVILIQEVAEHQKDPLVAEVVETIMVEMVETLIVKKV
jgi:hypothetical protein